MAQIRGQYKDPSGKIMWVPLEAVLDGTGYVLKVSGVAGGSVVTLGVPKHYNGNADIASANVAFAAATKSIFIENLHASSDLLVSFDGGTNSFVIPAGETLGLDAEVTSVALSASANTTPYQILTTE